MFLRGFVGIRIAETGGMPVSATAQYSVFDMELVAAVSEAVLVDFAS